MTKNDLVQEIVIIDYGSQYTRLILRRVRDLGYFAKLYLPETWEDELREQYGEAAVASVGAIILSGGPQSVADESAPGIDIAALESYGVPVIGICYGMQLLCQKFGGKVRPSKHREFGSAEIFFPSEVQAHPLFEGVRLGSSIWMSHSDVAEYLPEGAKVLATNAKQQPVAVEFPNGWLGIQFHPEVTHTDDGEIILRNFLGSIEGLGTFRIEDYKQTIIEQIRAEVGGHEVVCGVSGGVDSTVLAVLLREAGVKMHPILVDTGLMRLDEADEVRKQFEQLGIPLEVIDAQERFLEALRGVSEPEQKRRIIGRLFVDVFFEHAAPIDRLAQGTLYPDVIESATAGSSANTIKTHHNRVDRIMELKAEGKVIEPLAELFKDEVRALGTTLGIPHEMLWRHPFPGPGLGVRVVGEVTKAGLEIVREADAIFIEELRQSGWYERVWQAYAGLLPVHTVGVKGDVRSYEQPIVLRAITSHDAMTAQWVELPAELLQRVSRRILNEVGGVNRVFYDISTKPPASIELE